MYSVSFDNTGSTIDVTILTRGNALAITFKPTGAARKTVKMMFSLKEKAVS